MVQENASDNAGFIQGLYLKYLYLGVNQFQTGIVMTGASRAPGTAMARNVVKWHDGTPMDDSWYLYATSIV